VIGQIGVAPSCDRADWGIAKWTGRQQSVPSQTPSTEQGCRVCLICLFKRISRPSETIPNRRVKHYQSFSFLHNHSCIIWPAVSSEMLYHRANFIIEQVVSSYQLYHRISCISGPDVSSDQLYHPTSCIMRPALSSDQLYHPTSCIIRPTKKPSLLNNNKSSTFPFLLRLNVFLFTTILKSKFKMS
jgi:hypothetical protein